MACWECAVCIINLIGLENINVLVGDLCMSSDDYPEWNRRRRFPLDKDPFFGDIDRIFREMEKRMEAEFREFTEKVPKDYVKERKLPDGSTVKEFGPFVYGYSMKIGPDGKPAIREFGNIKKSLKGPEVREEREPLVDVVETDSEIRVVVELPGVEKTAARHGGLPKARAEVPGRSRVSQVPRHRPRGGDRFPRRQDDPHVGRRHL